MSRQLVANRTAFKEERRRYLQRLKSYALHERIARSDIRPSKAEAAIEKVLAMIREGCHQVEARSRAMQDLVLDIERRIRESRAGAGW